MAAVRRSEKATLPTSSVTETLRMPSSWGLFPRQVCTTRLLATTTPASLQVVLGPVMHLLHLATLSTCSPIPQASTTPDGYRYWAWTLTMAAGVLSAACHTGTWI